MSRRRSTTSVVHAVNDVGHRRSYVETLANMFDHAPLFASLNLETIRTFLRADRLILATFDDAPITYALVALLRGCQRRKTVALFLRPQTCLRTDDIKFKLKNRVYRTLLHLPGLTLVTITPHAWLPRLREVSHVGTYDPQYWDFFDGTEIRSLPHSPLAGHITDIAGAQTIICLPGFLSREKGFAFFTELATRQDFGEASILLVAAGAVLPEMRSAAELFERVGGLLIDRQLSEPELESLYGISDAIWACYAPDYDQASGIFGRAVQTGTPVIVRKGSMIEGAACDLASQAIALPYGDAPKASAAIFKWANSLSNGKRSTKDTVANAEKLAALRMHFHRTIQSAL